MRGSRDQHDLLTGDLDYGGGGWPITILSHIPAFLYVCTNCQAVSFHVVGEQPHGPGIKLPFAKKPLVTVLGKAYHIICNNCTVIAKQLSKEDVAKLEARVLPSDICSTLDSFYGINPHFPLPYTPEFPRAFVDLHKPDDLPVAISLLSIYRREK